ncbi:hypothetical protein GT347_21625 [Xylophilus rhododendri]|uniref:Chemotaxis methyl-accepting receptor HlyB-like 4HB MCP domain-containing protein n=1 Tax=Xylophilus rhododendri TaxID=2697032 RepID=A0A857JC86_9BURK|nr:MCP four helix bundle domain-containing protein [Xylophilus rhododendri]QHJ00349.1 hypothetical protein GT347_21625 [Xylophilus rhododendri]
MNPLRRLTEGPAIALTSSLICVALCLGLGISANVFSSNSNRAASQIATNWFPSVRAIGQIRDAAYELRRVEARVVLAERGCDGISCDAPLMKARQAMSRAESTYEPLVSEPDEHLLYQSYLHQKQDYFRSQDQVTQFAATRQPTAVRFLTHSQFAFDEMIETLSRLSDLNVREGAKSKAQVEEQHERTMLALNALTALLLACGGLLLFHLVRLSTRRR